MEGEVAAVDVEGFQAQADCLEEQASDYSSSTLKVLPSQQHRLQQTKAERAAKVARVARVAKVERVAKVARQWIRLCSTSCVNRTL
jgi:hypothetical protein